MDIEKEKKEEEERKKKEEEDKKKEEEEKKKKEPEPDFEIKSNPARVTTRQAKVLSFEADERYQPVKTTDINGIVMLRDTKPGTPEELVTPAAATGTAGTTGAQDNEPEPEAPEPFEYDPQKG